MIVCVKICHRNCGETCYFFVNLENAHDHIVLSAPEVLTRGQLIFTPHKHCPLELAQDKVSLFLRRKVRKRIVNSIKYTELKKKFWRWYQQSSSGIAHIHIRNKRNAYSKWMVITLKSVGIWTLYFIGINPRNFGLLLVSGYSSKYK